MATFDAKRNARFRELLGQPGILSIPACTDALSALILQRLGFNMITISGSGHIASMIGKPDTGLATATEVIDRARQIAQSVNIPVVADADTGYGNINNVRQTVRGFEAAGVSGIHIEDQVMPKKLGSMAGVEVIDSREMTEKIQIACKSRNDPNFVIIARTDAYAALGIDEVIHRCRLYAEAGADILYAHNILKKDHLEKLSASIRDVPLLYDVVEPYATYSDKELEDMGFKIVYHGRATVLCQAKAVTDLWTYYREHGETAGFIDRMMSPQEWSSLIDNDTELNIRDWLAR